MISILAETFGWHLAPVHAIATVLQMAWRFGHSRGVESSGLAFACIPPGSVIIVIASPKSAGLRIYNNVAGLLVLYAHDPVVASFVFDQDIRPALGRKFLPNLIFADRSIAGDENRSFAALPNEIKVNNHGRGDHEKDTCKHPYEHSVSHPRSPWNFD
jgi:hypothetical protein